MDSNWAAEHLQTIRTLMERSAVYRRALAPTMLGAGAIGLGFGALGWFRGGDNPKGFILLWLGAAIIGLATALSVIRRQAFSDTEPFWSSPTRRVAQAVLPAFIGGAALGMAALGPIPVDLSVLISLWTVLYGCGLHAAAFFMQRGMRWLSWLYIIMGSLFLLLQGFGRSVAVDVRSASLTMGLVFGAGHLLYGVYLWLTEPRKSP
jgi:hypothetical protein